MENDLQESRQRLTKIPFDDLSQAKVVLGESPQSFRRWSAKALAETLYDSLVIRF